MTFKEVNPNTWTYEKENDAIEGILVRAEKEVGPNKSMLYSLEVSPGVFKSVWGATVLDQKMCLVQVGSKIRITYLGHAEKKAGSKNPAKLFKVEIDSN